MDGTAKRARSVDQKAERQKAILSAARGLISDLGFDGVTMSALAKRAQVAKGTLYLYVRSKEELFLLLFVEAMEDVVTRFEAEACADQLPEQLTRLVSDTPLFLPLYARLAAVIEANVADEPLFAAKRRILATSNRFSNKLATLLEVPPARAEALSLVLFQALLGAAQLDLPSGRDPATLPAELRDSFAVHQFDRAFPPSVRHILGVD